MKSRLSLALAAFTLTVGLSDLLNYGHNYGRLLLLVGIYAALVRCGPRAWERILYGWFGYTLLAAVLCLWQLKFDSRPHGPFSSANFLGGYAVLNFFLLLRWQKSANYTVKAAFCWIVLAGILLMIGLAQSRGAWVALGAGLAVAYGHRAPRSTLLGIGGALACVLLLTYLRWDGTPDPRIGLWELGIKVALSSHQWLGWGQNALTILGAGSFYNVLIDTWIAAGAVGVAAGIGIFAEAARISVLRQEWLLGAILASWIANGMFIFDTAAIDVPLFITLALLASPAGRVADIARAVDPHEPALDRGV